MDKTYISLFAGVGGFDLALKRAGWRCVAAVEKDPRCRLILRRHFPEALLLEDVCDVGKHNLPPARLVVGGFPCQDLSVAGRRAGLGGDRSGLWYEYHRILTELRPEWVVIENVPGLLSSGPLDECAGQPRRGIDFAVVLAGLTGVVPRVPADGWSKAGFGRGHFYDVAWRCLDSQNWGVAQRRERVFIVGHLTACGGRPAKVLFESDSRAGDTSARREARQGSAGSVGTSFKRRGGFGWSADPAVAQTLEGSSGHGKPDRVPLVSVQSAVPQVAGTLAASGAGLIRAAGQKNELDFVIPFEVSPHALTEWDSYRMRIHSDRGLAPTLTAEEASDPVGNKDGTPVIGFNPQSAATSGLGDAIEQSPTLRAAGRVVPGVSTPIMGVRRLTPVECERLQGFPDDWTAWGVDEQGNRVEMSDTARYKQMGNAVTVNVVEWIVRRIPPKM